MTAIETYYIGPTNYRGSRVKARALGMGWHHHAWFGGDGGQKTGYVFVCALSFEALTFSPEQQQFVESSPRTEQ